MSLSKIGNIIKLFYSTDDGRVNTDELTLDDKGVLGDKYYNKDINKSVLITSQESYKLIANNGIDVQYSALGENIIMDSNPYHLNSGTQLSIGTIVLEISQHGTLCKGLTKIDSKLPKLLKGNRGLFAKVIKGGIMYKGDNIYLLNE